MAYLLADPTDEPSASTARAYLERGLLRDDITLLADGCLGGAADLKGALEHLLSSAAGEPLEALPQLLALPPARQRGCFSCHPGASGAQAFSCRPKGEHAAGF